MNNVILTLVQLHKPIIKNTVLFRSFMGQYNDNPKYVSEELHRRCPDIKIVWAFRDGKPESFPDYAELVKLDSAEYIKYVSRAEVVVDNYSGCRARFVMSNDIIKRAVYPRLCRRRAGQLNISTWHGTPLKHISLDEPVFKKAKYARAYLNADVLIAGCELTANVFPTALGWDKPVMMCGTPRNDILFGGYKEQMKQRLGLPLDKKIILFAPTFRDNVEMSGIDQLQSMNFEELFKTLNGKFGGEWSFVFRSHNLVMKQIQENGLNVNTEIINGNAHEDMAEYLLCADVLLTDYSSSMFDFALTGKPCFLYTPDIVNYRSNERGFYFDIASAPFPISETFEGLTESINNFDAEQYAENVKLFLESIGNTENGTAATQIVDKIIEHMKTRE